MLQQLPRVPAKNDHDLTLESPKFVSFSRSAILDAAIRNRLDTDAQAALQYAFSEATRSGHNEVSPLYLLAGILQAPEVAVDYILGGCGTTRNTMRAALLELLSIGPGYDTRLKVYLDNQAQRVIGNALQIARVRGDRSVSRMHLLLALVHSDGPARNLLNAQGVDRNSFARAIPAAHASRRSSEQTLNPLKVIGQVILMLLAFVIVVVFMIGCPYN